MLKLLAFNPDYTNEFKERELSMGETKLFDFDNGCPTIKQNGPHTLNLSLDNCQASKTDWNLIKLQVVATLIQVLKSCVLKVQKDVWQLRRLNFQSTISDIDPIERLGLIDEFEATKRRIKYFVESVNLDGIAILCGSYNQTVFSLTPTANIKEIRLNMPNGLKNGIYELICRVNKATSPVFTLALYQDQTMICEFNTETNILTPAVPQKISGLEVVFNDISTKDMLSANIGLINDAKLLSVGIQGFIYPGKYKILVEKSNDGLRAYLGRFSSKIKNLHAEVGGLSLEFSRKLLASEPNSRLTEVHVDYESIVTSIQIDTRIMPLSLEFEIVGKHQVLEFMPMLPEALLGNAFGKIVSLAELSIDKGFDPSLNLEILETINLSLNNYDKTLTDRLTYLKKLFTTQDKGSFSKDPELLLNAIEDELKIVPFRMFLKNG